MNNDKKVSLSKADRFKMFLRSYFLLSSFNYERMQNGGVAYTLIPAIKKLYSKKEDRAAALKRHLEFFNTHPFMANPIFGVTMALEEERANSADVDDAAISGVKIGMMGPLAGAGDPLFWFTLRPILLSLGASLAVSGNILGPLLFFILWNIMAAAVKWYTQEFGYKAGVSITDDLSGGLLQKVTRGASMMGVMVNQNQSLDKDTIEILAADYGIKAEEKIEVDVADIDKFFEEEQNNQDNLTSRPPVVTIMGHVDHGKTTLLDKLRHTNVTAGEAGGITQHIGAYQVRHSGKTITFLDTPGHAAFTNMRARGADITDITVLVVAADDGVMPQTIEAINHAKAANVPIIVAVNKIDKPGANPNHVMEQLSEYELIPESWGGDTIFVEISAKFNKNLEELLDMILLEAEMLELKANAKQHGAGSVIEARLDKGKGSVASLLVQHGTLHVGDPIVVGNTFGRVRTMTDARGRSIKKATPATPVEITGLNDVPDSGDRFITFDDEKTARAAGEERAKRALIKERNQTTHVTLDNLFDTLKEGDLKEVDLIIKADVQGSAEALAQSFKKIDVEGVRVNIIHQAVGAINESDVTLAEASNAIIIGFNVRPTPQAKLQAESDKVDIRLHNVIYKAIDEVETAMKGMLEPVFEEKVIGEVEIRETYKVSKLGTIGGGYVTDGHIQRDSGVRVIRDGIVIYEGKLASLKRFKDDVKQVKQGYECGLMIEKYNDIKVGDRIEAYVMEEVPQD